jgi:tetratricopeptide (TPR) repeat protein
VRVAARLVVAGGILSLAWLTTAQSQTPAGLALLTRYAAGEFDAVAAELETHTDFQQLLDDLKNHAPAWLDGGTPADRGRRELAAATFALEAARVAEWQEWKWIQRPPPQTTPLPTLFWRPAPLLIEWGCELLRTHEVPGPGEHAWQLAALAVAQRSEDPQFLIGMTQIVEESAEPIARAEEAMRAPLPRNRLEVGNPQKEASHLKHVRARFPDEPRFLLSEGLAREQFFPDEAALMYGQLADHPDIGGEALMRLGALQLRQNQLAKALGAFDRAERATRDTYVIHLARVFRGQIYIRQKRESAAIEALRGSLAAWPGAQSASVMLAELLFKADSRTEAQQVMAAVLAAAPDASDPYLEYAHADDRFWSVHIARLRREIRR